MFRKLLVPLDGSPLAEQAIGQAVAIARLSHAALDVMLVHRPLPFGGFIDAPWNAEQWRSKEAYLTAIAAEISSGSSVPVTHSVSSGETVEMICRHARDVYADLVVMTSHGRTGLSRAWLGSVADGVLRHSAVPVLMLRPVETTVSRRLARHLFKTILVPVDDSALSTSVLASAAALARAAGARILLLRVVQPVPLISPDAGLSFGYPPVLLDDPATAQLVNEAKEQVAEIARVFHEEYSVDTSAHVITAGHVAPAIIDFARGHGIELIAMSTRGRGASRLLIGSVADKVLRGSGLPMLLIRPMPVGEDADKADTLGEVSAVP